MTVYKTMLGKPIDMDKLIRQNEMTVAVGNARVNARGDELGPGGKIIRKREDVLNAASHHIPDEIARQPEETIEEIIPVKSSRKVKNDD